MFPVKILMKRNLTDWLLMVISGNNLMINFMATIVRWQARRGFKQKLYCTAVPASRERSISPLITRLALRVLHKIIQDARALGA
jgi:hypothetical protein